MYRLAYTALQSVSVRAAWLHAETVTHNWPTTAVTVAMTTLTGGHTVLDVMPKPQEGKDEVQYLVCASAEFP